MVWYFWNLIVFLISILILVYFNIRMSHLFFWCDTLRISEKSLWEQLIYLCSIFEHFSHHSGLLSQSPHNPYIRVRAGGFPQGKSRPGDPGPARPSRGRHLPRLIAGVCSRGALACTMALGGPGNVSRKHLGVRPRGYLRICWDMIGYVRIC
jgi:hypothetical protein